jgi:signal transduction histidine kinase
VDRVRQAWSACGRGLAVAGLALGPGLALFVAAVVAVALIPVGVGLLVAPPVLRAVRAFADAQRDRGRRWSGIAVDRPYRPDRPLADPATWRDLLWLLAGAPVGLVLGLLPACLAVNGVLGLVVAPDVVLTGANDSPFWALAVGVGVGSLALLAVAGPAVLRAHARFCAALLGPARQDLATRAERLAESRAEVVDAGAAELRRIERDLHDGAQARIAALGMTIGLAEQLVRADPDAAVALLEEARGVSGEALADLRRLVRGIHPPVLVERGLAGAVHALAATVPIPVDVVADVRQLPAPLEAGVYFVIAEALANVVKHSGATRATVRISTDGGRFVATVADDGGGGAAVGGDGGLAGVRRRLAAFDGTLSVASPRGGPTVVTAELPCES